MPAVPGATIEERGAPGPRGTGGPSWIAHRPPTAGRRDAAAALAAVVLVLASVPWFGVAGARAAGMAPGPVVQTREGEVQGLASDGVSRFLGIPYAQAPVGDLRWRPPEDRRPWDRVLQATRFGPTCAMTQTLGVYSGPRNDNEDCLYLNVFTPDAETSARLPVIVYVHGGGNVDGETTGLDGGKLASLGKVVVVTMEYRLNLMGFLAHPALDAEGHAFGNYGVLDQQAAMRWVRRNIAGFGGDGGNVTIAGQSAGALDVMIHMVSPRAEGLFQRAICQSYCVGFYQLPTKSAAEARGVAFAEAAGCGSGAGPEVARCLRGLPATKIEELAGSENASSGFVIVNTGMVDGQVVPDQPAALMKAGKFSKVPLINGATEDEINFTMTVNEYQSSGDPGRRTTPTVEQLKAYVKATFSAPYPDGTVEKILGLYSLERYELPFIAWGRIATDARLCSMRRLDEALHAQIPVYAYEFADGTAPSYFPDMPGFRSLAYHTGDIQYLFPLWHGGPLGSAKPLNARQTRLSDEIVASWGRFARTGNPNGSGDEPWPRYAPGGAGPAWSLQDLRGPSTLTDRQYAERHRCDFWDEVSPIP